MSFFYAVNLVEKSVFEGNPWEFQPTEALTEQLRIDKHTRQEFYQNVSTKHSFYTVIEGSNPNQRISKDNPPRLIHGFAADYDIKIPKDRIDEVVKVMKIKPAYVEKSLGRNSRLVWTLPRPLPVDDYDFCVYILQQAARWLSLDLLPGLDEGAFTTPTRLLCNGCEWENTGHNHIPEPELQAFFVECGRGFRFNSTATVDVPLETVEKSLQAAFPSLSWPGEFVLGSQGPSFWLPNSTSPMSAIVKKDGMFTFSNSAEKPFYSWSDLLGPDFIKDFSVNAISKATNDIYWDGKSFWRKIKGVFAPLAKDELINFFEMSCGMTNETSKGKKSMVKQALEHIYNENRVLNAAPYVFRPPGVILYQSKRRLNTYMHNLIPPAAGTATWGPQGEFPFLSALFDGWMDKIPLTRILAWFKYYYECGLYLNPQPGPMVIIMGEVESGKTLINREVFGRAVGGFVDAQNYLVGGNGFTEHMYEVPHWCLDDDTISDSLRAHTEVQANFKKIVANKDFYCNQKFRVAGMTEWHGRLVVTTNLDFVSTRIAGTLDNGTMDKISMFRCNVPQIKFPARQEIIKIRDKELPCFLRWLVDWVVPDDVPRHGRFGFRSYQDEGLMEQAHQSSRFAPFKELLIESLVGHFESKATEWRGTVTQLQRLISSNPLNDGVLRALKLDQINRYLESVQREGIIPCRVEPGPLKIRIWVFPKFSSGAATPEKPVEPPALTQQSNAVNIFSK